MKNTAVQHPIKVYQVSLAAGEYAPADREPGYSAESLFTFTSPVLELVTVVSMYLRQ